MGFLPAIAFRCIILAILLTVVQGCAAGKYLESGSCTECIPRYSCADGVNKILCVPGRYQDSPGQTFCMECTQGMYQPSNCDYCDIFCLSCPTGKYSTAYHMSAETGCILCPAGTYGGSVAASSCTPCPVGRYTDIAGYNECTLCSPGSYAASNSTISCSSCGAGKFSTDIGGTAASSCRECPFGTYESSVGASQCTPCRSGTFGTVTGSTSASSCQPCASGTYTNNAGNSACTNCPPGTYSFASGGNACTSCGPGTYADVAGLSLCSECPAGKFNFRLGSMTGSACTACAVGTYGSSRGQASCTSCSPGYYTFTVASTTCASCAPGKYADAAGTSACTPCGAGTYNPQAAGASASSCLPCPVGTYSASTGISGCTACGAGTHNAETGKQAAADCIACPAGRYQGATGASGCADCPAGKFGTVTGSTSASSCQPCASGTYTNHAGNSACTNCPPGTYSFASGGNACTPCGPGTYSGVPGLRTCKICPLGSTLTQLGGTSVQDCLKCSQGTYGTQNICVPCSPGYYASIAGATSCTECGIGKFSVFFKGNATAGDSSYCESCAKGFFASARGMASCSVCSAGSFAPRTSMGGCLLCDADTFAANNASIACLPCADGMHSIPGAVSCSVNQAPSVTAGAAFVEAMTTGNSPFYIVICFSLLYGAIGIAFDRIKSKSKFSDQILKAESLFQLIFSWVNSGNALFSQLMVIFGLMSLDSSAFRLLGLLLACSLFIGAIPTISVISGLWCGGKPKQLPTAVVDNPETAADAWKGSTRYRDYIHVELFTTSRKLYAVLLFLCLFDSKLVMSFPWLLSPFSSSTGYPNYKLCSLASKVQSATTLLALFCQVGVLVENHQTSAVPKNILVFVFMNSASHALNALYRIVVFSLQRAMLKELGYRKNHDARLSARGDDVSDGRNETGNAEETGRKKSSFSRNDPSNLHDAEPAQPAGASYTKRESQPCFDKIPIGSSDFTDGFTVVSPIATSVRTARTSTSIAASKFATHEEL